jgi:hypothetical protein
MIAFKIDGNSRYTPDADQRVGVSQPYSRWGLATQDDHLLPQDHVSASSLARVLRCDRATSRSFDQKLDHRRSSITARPVGHPGLRFRYATGRRPQGNRNDVARVHRRRLVKPCFVARRKLTKGTGFLREEPRFPSLAIQFPVCSEQFPVCPRKFPAPLRREYGAKTPANAGLLIARSRLSWPKSTRFSVLSLLIREFRSSTAVRRQTTASSTAA